MELYVHFLQEADKTKLIPSGELIVVVDVIGSTMIVEPLSEGDELSSEEN